MGQIVDPSQEFQNRTDQILFSDGLVRFLEPTRAHVEMEKVIPELGERLGLVHGSFPLGSGLDAVGEEIVSE